MNVAADIGNGFTKVSINNKRLPLEPSVVSKVTHDIPKLENSDPQEILKSLDENLDISIQSSLSMNGRYLVGKAALCNTFSQISYNVKATADKAHDDITLIMCLSMITLGALQTYRGKKIPEQIDINVEKLATALPLMEAATSEHREALTKRYMGTTHVITVNNFPNPVTVHIHVRQTVIASEGIIGNVALVYDPQTGTYRNNSFYNEFSQKYNLKNFTGKSIYQFNNIIGIDIGDGTVDISVVGKNLALNTNESKFIDSGIGNVIDSAIQQLRQKKGININSRQIFVEQAFRNDERGKYYLNLINENLPIIEAQINNKIKEIYQELNGDIDLIYFHGAGANLIKSTYTPELNKLLKQVDLFNNTKVLWIPKEQSQWLNLEGLQVRLLTM